MEKEEVAVARGVEGVAKAEGEVARGAVKSLEVGAAGKVEGGGGGGGKGGGGGGGGGGSVRNDRSSIIEGEIACNADLSSLQVDHIPDNINNGGASSIGCHTDTAGSCRAVQNGVGAVSEEYRRLAISQEQGPL